MAMEQMDPNKNNARKTKVSPTHVRSTPMRNTLGRSSSFSSLPPLISYGFFESPLSGSPASRQHNFGEMMHIPPMPLITTDRASNLWWPAHHTVSKTVLRESAPLACSSTHVIKQIRQYMCHHAINNKMDQIPDGLEALDPRLHL